MKGLEKITAEEIATLGPEQVVTDASEAQRAGTKAAVPATAARSGLLDLGWARVRIPIVEIADRLGLARRGKSATCPFHPDCNPSLSFYRNRFRCHSATCGRRGNVLDLVVGVLRCDVGGALDWLLAQGYQIPLVDPEAHRRWRGGRVGVGGVGLDVVVQSGLLGRLPKPAGLVLCTLAGLTDPDSGQIEISYLGLARRSGIRDRNKISEALKLLRWLGLIEWRPASSPAGFRAPSQYTLSVDASSCHLAVEKLALGVFDGMYGGTVKSDQSMTGGTQSLPLGNAGSHLFTENKKRPQLQREEDAGRKSPDAGKRARPVEKKAAGGRRRRRVRHPGYTDWRRLP